MVEKRNWVQSLLQIKCFVRRLRDLPHIKQTIFSGIISMDLQKDGNKTWQHFEFYGKKFLELLIQIELACAVKKVQHRIGWVGHRGRA